MKLPHIYQVTKYDPDDWDESGRYIGPEDVFSDHGPVESAYLAAVRAFIEDSDLTSVTVREPAVTGFVNFGVEPPIPGHGLDGVFPRDLTGFHDGAHISIDVAVHLVRAMLRDNGAWCRLEVEDRFFVHIGFDQYMYVGSDRPCDRAISLARDSGLFVEPVDASPYAADYDDDPDAPERCADEAFWAQVGAVIGERGAVLLDEGYLGNASRWHRLHSADELHAVRRQLAPRSRLLVWPDLSEDIDSVLAALAGMILANVVWQDRDGHMHNHWVDQSVFDEISAVLADARAAIALPGLAGEGHPLLAAVLPDDDGILRARWNP